MLKQSFLAAVALSCVQAWNLSDNGQKVGPNFDNWHVFGGGDSSYGSQTNLKNLPSKHNDGGAWGDLFRGNYEFADDDYGDDDYYDDEYDEEDYHDDGDNYEDSWVAVSDHLLHGNYDHSYDSYARGGDWGSDDWGNGWNS